MCDSHTSEKEIVGHTSDHGSKRQLPPWMLPKVGAPTIPTSKSDNAVNDSSLEEEALAKAPDLTETSRRKSHSQGKREVKRRKGLSEQDASSDNRTARKDNKKLDSSKVRVQRTSLKESQIVDNFDVNSVQAFTDDDMELTIEDMMAIAEEYVKEYEKKEQKEESTSQCESVKQFPATSESASSLDSHCEGKRSSTAAREGLLNSTLNKTGELVTTGTPQTGDPAQDMLDLFLGPLLKKPLEEKIKYILEGMEFTHESTRKSQEGFAGEELVLSKKKSSLKDKVALLLD